MTDMLRIGIDPGSNGCMVALSENTYDIKETIKFKNGATAYQKAFKYLTQNRERIKIVNLELVHSIFGVSAKSNFTFGKNAGRIEAIVELSNVPFLMVPPPTWQKPLFVGMAKGGKAKVKSKLVFDRLFPQYRDIKDDGIVDASLIALYLPSA